MASKVRWALLAAALLALWELVPTVGWINRIIVAPPSAIWAALAKDPIAVINQTNITVLEVGAAIAISWVIGLAAGVVLGSSVRALRFLGPLLESAYALPCVVRYPLAVVWLGIGSTSKVSFAAATAIFPIALSTAAAVSMVEDRTLLLGRALGASRLQMYTKVLIPFALPQIISGLRVGAGLAVIGVLVGEMLLSVGGLGFMISYYRSTFDSGYVYLALLIGVGMAAFVNWAIGRVERRIGWWNQTSR
ncbi:MAG: ABC transporter permease subunit [Chloroflexota bacterium]